jgi:predicted histone-like DNA-binding protein
MALRIRLVELKRKGLVNRWFGKVVSRGEVHTDDLARSICHATSLTESDVKHAVDALVAEMTRRLQDGSTVVLDGFGRFHLTIQSDMVEKPEDYNLKKHVKRILCKFTPAGKRNQFDRHLERPFIDGVDLVRG